MKTPKVIIALIAALCALHLAAAPFMAQPDDATLAEAKLNDGNYAFAFDLLNQIATEEPGQNIFISPFRVSTAMQMVAEGAAGTTKSEIQRALKTGTVPPAKLTAAWEQLNASINKFTGGQLNLADGMWYQKDFQLNPDFAAAVRDPFHAELEPVDFHDAATARLINDWAAKETVGKINDIVSFPFPPKTKLVLANAIYFKANWRAQFDKALTKPRDFYLPSGIAKQTPMMSKQTEFQYQETDDYQAVQLPYDNRSLQMVIFLPKKHLSLQQLLADFSNPSWTARHPYILSAGHREGTLMLPKFKLDYQIVLNDTLKRLGIRRAFDPVAADFSTMGTGPAPLYISEVKQKSFAAVDEEGTEAASATIAIMTMGIDENPPKPFEMIVNRPFLFVITTDAWTGSESGPVVLFMGVVNDPVGEF